VYRGPPEVYRGPCMKITCLNSHITYTFGFKAAPYGVKHEMSVWLP